MSTAMLKESIAVVVYSPEEPGKVLLVQRPEEDAELPGIWGLPAVTLQPGEGDEVALRRLVRQKLGTELLDFRFLCSGEQQRARYRLRMRLYGALLAGTPRLPQDAPHTATYYRQWRWGELEELRAGALQGSLCCQLALDYHGYEGRAGGADSALP